MNLALGTVQETVSKEPVQPETVNEKGGLSFLEVLAQDGINVKLGLEYCSDEEEFYREMLEMFCSQYEEKRDEMNALYESAAWADYAIKVHALKSTSLTIGAEELSGCAKMLTNL